MYGYYFFFQAEDGIRDPLVTGVQTCALPIGRATARRLSHTGGGGRTVVALDLSRRTGGGRGTPGAPQSGAGRAAGGRAGTGRLAAGQIAGGAAVSRLGRAGRRARSPAGPGGP